MSPTAFFTLGLKGPAADARRAAKDALATGDGAGRNRNPMAQAAADEAAARALGTPIATPTPPNTTLLGSEAMGGARAAAEKQRKRAAAGSSLLTATPQAGGPSATLAPVTLGGA